MKKILKKIFYNNTSEKNKLLETSKKNNDLDLYKNESIKCKISYNKYTPLLQDITE